MALIEFENLPSTDTPISAENLNNNFNELNKSNVYSIDETDTGKKWIDGKPIYRKVVDFGVLPDGTITPTKAVAHGISNLGTIINLQGFMTNGTSYISLPYFYPSSSYVEYGIGVEGIDTTNITVTCGTNRSNSNAYFIIEYTKTTD